MTLLLLLALLVPTPEGFRESARLTPIAGAIAGKPSSVICARTDTAWTALLAPYDFPPNVDAITLRDEPITYLSPPTCRRLEGWLRGKNAPTLRDLGVVALSFTHEAMHLRGILGEREAECGALQRLPAVLKTHFKVRRADSLRIAMAAARANHLKKPLAYRGC